MGKGNESRKKTFGRRRRNAETASADAGDAEKDGSPAG